MMHKTCPINYGHLADLQKALPTIDLNKKKLSFDKISPRDFYFCPFFSICTCSGYGVSQWETTSQCSVVSYWLTLYLERSMLYFINYKRSNFIHFFVKNVKNAEVTYLVIIRLFDCVPHEWPHGISIYNVHHGCGFAGIHPSHKSHTSSINHNAPFCNRNGALRDICLMHCGIHDVGLLIRRLRVRESDGRVDVMGLLYVMS